MALTDNEALNEIVKLLRIQVYPEDKKNFDELKAKVDLDNQK